MRHAVLLICRTLSVAGPLFTSLRSTGGVTPQFYCYEPARIRRLSARCVCVGLENFAWLYICSATYAADAL